LAWSCDRAAPAISAGEEFFEAIATGVATVDRKKIRLIEIAVIEFLLITFVILSKFDKKRII
jgi:hypothetical protein